MQPAPAPCDHDQSPAEVAKLFAADLRLALHCALGMAAAAILLIAAGHYLAPPPAWSVRPAVAVAMAPAIGGILWLCFVLLVGFVFHVADANLPEESARRFALFPAWQTRACWAENMTRPAVRARRVAAFLVWWAVVFLAVMLFPYLV